MFFLLLFMMSYVVSALVTRMERSRNIAETRPRITLFGQWPYNVVLLAGIALGLLASGRQLEIVVQGIVIVATVAFYAVTLYKLR